MNSYFILVLSYLLPFLFIFNHKYSYYLESYCPPNSYFCIAIPKLLQILVPSSFWSFTSQQASHTFLFTTYGANPNLTGG
jgi:hypothetical protein